MEIKKVSLNTLINAARIVFKEAGMSGIELANALDTIVYRFTNVSPLGVYNSYQVNSCCCSSERHESYSPTDVKWVNEGLEKAKLMQKPSYSDVTTNLKTTSRRSKVSKEMHNINDMIKTPVPEKDLKNMF